MDNGSNALSRTGTPQDTVAVFCNTFLPYSQTFVWDELRAHERFGVEVFAWRRQHADLFPLEVRTSSLLFPVTRRDSRFDERLAHGDIKLIHAHFGWAGACAVPFARRHDLPLIITFHGYDVALLAAGRMAPPFVWPYTLRARETLSAMSLGLCASAELLEMLVSIGVPRGKLIEHHIGVSVDRFKSAGKNSQDLQVAMVGRFVPKKGFENGIRAFAAAAARVDVPMQLSIAGSGPLGGSLKALVRSLNIEPRVRFLGELAHAEVAQLLGRSDVLLAPSVVAPDGDRDSGLLSAKEASACECIPIATLHGGIPSIIDNGVTGYLVAEHDVDAIATRLAALAASPAQRAAMGSAAREKMVRQFELRQSVRRLEQYYDDVVRRHTARERLSAGTRVSRPSKR